MVCRDATKKANKDPKLEYENNPEGRQIFMVKLHIT